MNDFHRDIELIAAYCAASLCPEHYESWERIRARLPAPVAVPADQEPITAGPRNYYGSLEIRCKDDVPEWCVENYSGHHWEPCPRPVYNALLAAALAAQKGE